MLMLCLYFVYFIYTRIYIKRFVFFVPLLPKCAVCSIYIVYDQNILNNSEFEWVCSFNALPATDEWWATLLFKVMVCVLVCRGSSCYNIIAYISIFCSEGAHMCIFGLMCFRCKGQILLRNPSSTSAQSIAKCCCKMRWVSM